jgi:hypothetical protein
VDAVVVAVVVKREIPSPRNYGFAVIARQLL